MVAIEFEQSQADNQTPLKKNVHFILSSRKLQTKRRDEFNEIKIQNVDSFAVKFILLSRN